MYRQLQHAAWHTEPITFKDCVMPFFLLAMGISLTLSLSRRLQSKTPRGNIWRKIAIRSLIILGLGLGLHFIYFRITGNMRIPGVLQRLALVYFICGCVFLFTNWRGQLVLLIVLLAGYWMVLILAPVPGVGAANLEQGANICAWVDRAVFNGYLHPRFKTSDPQGLLGSISAVCSCLIGVLAGHWLVSNRRFGQKSLGFFAAAAGLIVLGRVWGLFFPISRDLWTGSYVLYTSGIAMLVWATLYWLISVKGFEKGTGIWAAYGTSCIFIFMASHALALSLHIIEVPLPGGGSQNLHVLLFENVFRHAWLSPETSSLLFACGMTIFWMIPLYFMYKMRIFIKI